MEPRIKGTKEKQEGAPEVQGAQTAEEVDVALGNALLDSIKPDRHGPPVRLPAVTVPAELAETLGKYVEREGTTVPVAVRFAVDRHLIRCADREVSYWQTKSEPENGVRLPRVRVAVGLKTKLQQHAERCKVSPAAVVRCALVEQLPRVDGEKVLAAMPGHLEVQAELLREGEATFEDDRLFCLATVFDELASAIRSGASLDHVRVAVIEAIDPERFAANLAARMKDFREELAAGVRQSQDGPPPAGEDVEKPVTIDVGVCRELCKRVRQTGRSLYGLLNQYITLGMAVCDCPIEMQQMVVDWREYVDSRHKGTLPQFFKGLAARLPKPGARKAHKSKTGKQD